MEQQRQVPISEAVGFSASAEPMRSPWWAWQVRLGLQRKPTQPTSVGEWHVGSRMSSLDDSRHLGLHAACCIQYQSQGFNCYSALPVPALTLCAWPIPLRPARSH